MNLPALQRIAMEFEKENDIMDQRQDMMDDAIDDVTGLEDEEEGEEVVNQVLDEIGIDLGQAVSFILPHIYDHHILIPFSLEKHQKDFRKMQSLKDESPRPLVVVMQVMMICRPALTACVDESTHISIDILRGVVALKMFWF